MQTEVAVFSNAGLWVDKADVVTGKRRCSICSRRICPGPSSRCWFPDRGELPVSGRREHRRIETLLTRTTNTICASQSQGSIFRSTGKPFRVLSRSGALKPDGTHRQVSCWFRRKLLCIRRSDALVLVKDHDIVGLGRTLRYSLSLSTLNGSALFLRAAGQRENEQRTGSRALNESSPVDGTHNVSPRRNKSAL